MAVRLKERSDKRLAQIAAIKQLKRALSAYGREHGGRFIVFGSAARREMRPDSDVDLLVDFPDAAQSDAIRFADDACERLGLRPDILGFGWPAGRIRTRIEEEGLVLPGDENRWSRPLSGDDRWGDILDAAKSASWHFRAADRIYSRGGLEDTGDEAYVSRMAFYHSMQSAHTSLESALKRALVAIGQKLPSGKEWHKALVRLSTQPLGPRGEPIMDAELAGAVSKTLGFRHFASDAYDAPFKPDVARPAVEAGLLLADKLEPALLRFAKANGAPEPR